MDFKLKNTITDMNKLIQEKVAYFTANGVDLGELLEIYHTYENTPLAFNGDKRLKRFHLRFQYGCVENVYFAFEDMPNHTLPPFED